MIENMIEIFKNLNKFDKMNPEVLFEMNNASIMRVNDMKLNERIYNRLFFSFFFYIKRVLAKGEINYV